MEIDAERLPYENVLTIPRGVLIIVDANVLSYHKTDSKAQPRLRRNQADTEYSTEQASIASVLILFFRHSNSGS